MDAKCSTNQSADNAQPLHHTRRCFHQPPSGLSNGSLDATRAPHYKNDRIEGNGDGDTSINGSDPHSKTKMQSILLDGNGAGYPPQSVPHNKINVIGGNRDGDTSINNRVPHSKPTRQRNI